MSRRFVPNQSKSAAPSTPHAQRVLPTPPATETPVFRLAPAGDTVDPSPQHADTRPGTAPVGQQSGIAPKLNISRFTQNKGQKNQTHLANNRATHSPARLSKPLARPQTSGNEDQMMRPPSIFGRQNGLLPTLTRQSPPMSPGPISPLAQPANSRFSSPVSSVAGDGPLENSEEKTFEETRATLDNTDAHTSGLNALGQARTTSITQHHGGFQNHSVVGHEINPEDDLEEQEAQSPSPVAFSKRRAEGHDPHVSAKRARPRYGYEEVEYVPQTQAQPEPPISMRPKTLFSSSLDAYIEAHQTEWLTAKKRWEDCTMDEWKNGPAELAEEFNKVMDMVKDVMTKRMEVYARINKDVDAHKLRLDARDALLTKEKERLVKHAGSLASSFVAS